MSFGRPLRATLAVVLVSCSAMGCGDRTADEGSGEDGAPSCDGVLYQDICYRMQPVFQGGAFGTQLVSLGETQPLAVVGVTPDGLAIATWVGQADQPFEVQVHPLEYGGSGFVGIGDFVGDGLQRIIITDGRFEIAYTLDGDTPTGAPLVTATRPHVPLEELWGLEGPIDLADGSSVMVAQDGWGMLGTFRLDVPTKDWVPVAPTIEGPPWAVGSVVLDANRDGLRDLVVWGNADDSQAHVLISDGVGGVVSQDLGTPCDLGDTGQIHAGDLTGDGTVDLACSAGNDVQLLANDGEGLFESAVTVYTTPPFHGFYGIADMLGDGTNDLLVGDYAGQEDSFGFVPGPFADANFVELGFNTNDPGAIADFDNDGLDEIVVEIFGDTYVIDPDRI
jgi:hypothetical protein